MRPSLLLVLTLTLTLAQSVASSAHATQSVRGVVKVGGSSTMAGLIAAWGTAFRKQHPGARIDISAKGSQTAPPALVAGKIELAAMSRRMTSAEKAVFATKMGYRSTMIGVAFDAVALFVHKNNRLKSLTLHQLDRIFSADRQRLTSQPGGAPMKTWGQLGATGRFAKSTIVPLGRNAASGTRAVMLKRVLKRGKFGSAVVIAANSKAVVAAVARKPGAIGFASAAHRQPGVRMVPIGKAGEPTYAPTAAQVMNRRYPLGRMLYLYINKKAGVPFSPVAAKFVAFALSPAGQKIATQLGFIGMPAYLTKSFSSRLQ